jgi:hypothetical protein
LLVTGQDVGFGYSRIEDPVLDTTVGLVRRVLGLGPVHLDLLSKALGILLSALLRLLALEGQVVLERLGIPAGVGSDNLVVPVGLDSRLEVLAVRGAGVGDAVVAEPALKLRLVPLVVDCFLALVDCCMTLWIIQKTRKGLLYYTHRRFQTSCWPLPRQQVTPQRWM